MISVSARVQSSLAPPGFIWCDPCTMLIYELVHQYKAWLTWYTRPCGPDYLLPGTKYLNIMPLHEILKPCKSLPQSVQTITPWERINSLLWTAIYDTTYTQVLFIYFILLINRYTTRFWIRGGSTLRLIRFKLHSIFKQKRYY